MSPRELPRLLSDQRDYHRGFTEAHGSGPWPCFFCAHEVLPYADRQECKDRELVHHINEDRTDDRPENLSACHWASHTSHHMTANDWALARIAGFAAQSKKGADGKSITGRNAGLAAHAKRTPEQVTAYGRLGGLAGVRQGALAANAVKDADGTSISARKAGLASQARLTARGAIRSRAQGRSRRGSVTASTMPLVSCLVCRQELRKNALKQHLAKHTRQASIQKAAA